ncbi:phage tail length tape measure family protein [Pseudomonas asiatica]|uniref:phage tail length tape measure family protein n=1 Tax=Pseudomonas asiatica TaxID=2219225 RepID=UPI001E525C9A|nr:phage tail length tape measure family protein [Pseudomonas asiatica]MCE1032714.1 phage tail length tape measure family protein [Pseudomonas asiatica]
MAQESRLAVTIDSRGAKRNADDLTGSLERMERAGDAAAASADGVSSSLDDQRKELSQLLGQINPTVAALGRLDDMQEKLAKFKKAGIVESDTFVEYTQRINTMRDALGETAEGMNKAGMSAKAYQAALRGVPAQFTDIAVSLQSGQAPLTVLLQQGGQLKDMFGGVGPAAQALGGYILGLVNPFTVAAAAAGALTLAYYKGSEQSDALRNSLILTGNFSKASEAQLISLAESADQVTGTFGQAAGALAQLTAAGENTTGNFKLITTTAVEMQRVTGKAIEETVAEFIKLGKDPVAGIVELDEKYRFLTASVYAQIKALSDQGKAVAAADLAERTYAEAMGQRTSKIRENLGVIERGWLNIKDATNEVLDAFASIGRNSAESEQSAITRLQQELAYRTSLLDTGYEDDTTRSRIAEIEKEIAQKKEILDLNRKTLEEEEKRRRIQEEGRKGLEALDSSYKSALTQTQRLNKDLTDLDKAKAKAVAAGVFTAAEEAKYATARKNIEQEIADIKTREAKKNAPKNVNRGVAEAENTFARLYGQYDPAAQAARALTKEQTQLDLALSKGKITQEEYSKALAQASLNYAAIVQGQDQHLVRLKQINEEYVKGQSLAELYAQKSAATEIQGPAGKIAQAGIDSSINNQVFSGKPNTSQIDAVIGGAGSELMRMTQENEQLQAWYDQRIAMYQQYRELEVENAAQYDETIRQLEKQRAEDTVNNERSMSVARLSLAEGMFGDLTSIVGAFAGQQSGAYKAMFAVQKAASIAQSIISIQTGIAMAAANPFPLNLAAMASVAAATASIVGNIQSVGLNLATGGYVRGPGTGTSDSIPANLSNGEFVVNAAATKRNRALLEAINSNERVSVAGGGGAVVSTQAGSSGASGIQQNIYIQNHTTAQVEQRRMPNGDLEFVIREATDRAVQEVAGQLASGYGDVVNAGEGAYGWKRPGD